MRGTARTATVAIAAALACGTLTIAEERASTSPLRTTNPILSAAIRDGMERSRTFRRVAEKIATEKGIVYLEAGRCHDVMRSCMLMRLEHAGAYRVLFVMVDPEQDLIDVAGSIGHELQHVTEILDTNVQTSSAMFAFYLRYGQRIAGHFETPIASRIAKVVQRDLHSRKRRHERVDTVATAAKPGDYRP